jgi:hypothetical protein
MKKFRILEFLIFLVVQSNYCGHIKLIKINSIVKYILGQSKKEFGELYVK